MASKDADKDADGVASPLSGVDSSEGDRLDEAFIQQRLAAEGAVTRVEVVETIGSTSDELAQRARRQPVSEVALLAEQQTAGRGRQGKLWVSPFARNLYLTVAWQLPGTPQDLAGLSLAVGAAVADALDHELGTCVQLKWPNDFYLNDRKLGGVLIDVVNAAQGGMTVLIGLGLNIRMPPAESGAIDQPIADLSDAMPSLPARSQVAVWVISAIEQVLARWPAQGFAPWRDQWSRRDWLSGQRVIVSGAQSLQGVASGISEEGALLVKTDAQVVPIWGGEVSVRRDEARLL